MLRAALFLMVCLHSISYGQEDTADYSLPEFNYWELSQRLLMYKDLREKLDVSPSQVDAIAEMRSRQDLADLLANEMRKLQALDPVKPISKSKVFASLDDTIVNELAKILEVEQIRGLRLLCMRKVYPTGFSPFSDAKVIQPDNVQLLKSAVEIQQQAFLNRMDAHRMRAGKSILEQLPAESRQLFVEYAGNKFLPELQVQTSRVIPQVHSKTLHSLGLFERYFQSNEFRKVLSPSEVAGAQEILRENSPSIQKYQKQSEFKTFLEYAREMEKRGSERLLKVLSQKTIMTFVRLDATFDFQHDFRFPFEQKAIVDYLELSPEKLDEIKSVAKVELLQYRKNMAELNEETFRVLSSQLNLDERKRVDSVFEDVWKFDSWDDF